MSVAHLSGPFAARLARLRRGADGSPAGAGGRRGAITWTKRLLPVGALLLLGAVALWPELNRTTDRERVTLKHLTATTGAARMLAPRYRGVDLHDRPFTVTAETGTQMGPERIQMVKPKADVALDAGVWLFTGSQHGVYMQRSGLLDLSGDATLYRSDGTTMVSDAATVDTKLGAASSHDRTHAEGPFGTLDAQGFALLDKGDVIQFAGPAHLVLNAHAAAAPTGATTGAKTGAKTAR